MSHKIIDVNIPTILFTEGQYYYVVVKKFGDFFQSPYSKINQEDLKNIKQIAKDFYDNLETIDSHLAVPKTGPIREKINVVLRIDDQELEN